jgi:hypothetical protein
VTELRSLKPGAPFTSSLFVGLFFRWIFNVCPTPQKWHDISSKVSIKCFIKKETIMPIVKFKASSSSRLS